MLNIGKDLKIDEEFLKKHLVVFGGSGSGKTVFSKVIIEELTKKGIPSLLIDTQGDLASMKVKIEGFDNSKVNIFTPASSKGIQLSINPLNIPDKLDQEEASAVISQISNSIVKIIKVNLDSEKGEVFRAFLYDTILQNYTNKDPISDFNTLARVIENDDSEEIISKREKSQLTRKIKLLTIGDKKILFSGGFDLDFDKLFSDSQVNVIYMNTLKSDNDKDYFLSMISLRLYDWMLRNPSNNLQSLFFIDEIAKYLPSGNYQTASKPILNLIYKQARKYGLGCVIATQNPGDVDYKSFAQFGSWSIGRLTAEQDREKIKTSLESVAGRDVKDLVLQLPSLKPGEFLFFSPDNFDNVIKVKSRLLLTEHKTLTEIDIKNITTQEDKDEFLTEEGKKDYGNVIKKKTIEKQVKSKSSKCFLIKYDKEQIMNITEKKKKKEYLLFGAKENITYIELKMKPFFLTKIRVSSSKFLGIGKQLIDYQVLFDGENGDLYVLNGLNIKRIEGFDYLVKLNDKENLILKILNDSKNKMSQVEVNNAAGFNVSEILKRLKDKKLVNHDVGKNKAYLWYSIFKNNLNTLNKLISSGFEVGHYEEGDYGKFKIDLVDIESAVRGWFGSASIVEHEKIYYPNYKISLESKKKSRVLSISAVNGKVVF